MKWAKSSSFSTRAEAVRGKSGRSTGVSDAGRRGHQEDAWLVEERQGGVMLVVADGMGGHAAGEVASSIAVRAFRRVDALVDESDGIPALLSAAERANQEILEYAEQNPGAAGLGTTVVLAWVQGSRALIGHAGDSRAWLVQGDEVELLTRDHSAVQDAMDRGTLNEEDIEKSPYRHAILRNLGDPDFPGLELTPERGRLDLPSGSILLLTSDGAHGFLSEAEILEHFSGTQSLDEGLSHLLRVAYHNGSDDNITLVGHEIGQFPRSGIPAQEPQPIRQTPKKTEHRKRSALFPMLLLVLLAVVFGMIMVILRQTFSFSDVPAPASSPVGLVSPTPPPVETVLPADDVEKELQWATPIPVVKTRHRKAKTYDSHQRSSTEDSGDGETVSVVGAKSNETELPDGNRASDEGSHDKAKEKTKIDRTDGSNPLPPQKLQYLPPPVVSPKGEIGRIPKAGVSAPVTSPSTKQDTTSVPTRTPSVTQGTPG